jgi:hypothetical protein|tara:strand:+ start:173 stop:397 length:225 start_codon:yes stop_codon:yes gene_type:complete
MQPKDVPTHIRIRYEPTLKQKQKECRLYGKDFISVAEAARYWSITYAWAAEQVRNGWNQETFPPKARKNYVRHD